MYHYIKYYVYKLWTIKIYANQRWFDRKCCKIIDDLNL